MTRVSGGAALGASVALGGAVGTLLRLAVDALLGGGPVDLATMLVNLTGAFALGLVQATPPADQRLRAFLGPGLLGAFTTFSALLLAFTATSWGHAALGLVVSIVGGIGAAWLGWRVGRSRSRAR